MINNNNDNVVDELPDRSVSGRRRRGRSPAPRWPHHPGVRQLPLL